jgi:hypothetical protein
MTIPPLKRSSVENALEALLPELDQIKAGPHKSIKYDLLWKGHRFPPKVVVTRAVKIERGVELTESEFSGGMHSGQASAILEGLGFTIVRAAFQSGTGRRVYQGDFNGIYLKALERETARAKKAKSTGIYDPHSKFEQVGGRECCFIRVKRMSSRGGWADYGRCVYQSRCPPGRSFARQYWRTRSLSAGTGMTFRTLISRTRSNFC